MSHRAVAAWSIAWLLAVTPYARAQNAVGGPAGEALLREGVELRRAGHDVDALDRFSRAYAASQSPIALAQMGLAEQALGRWVPSEAHVREALASRGSAWIEQNRAPIEAAYAVIARHVGSLEIDGTPRGAAVVIHGERVATLPLDSPVRRLAGRVSVVVTAVGYRPAARTVSIVAARVAHEHFDLERSDGYGYLLRPVAVASAGLSVVALVTGVVAAAVREDAVVTYNTDPSCPGASLPRQPAGCLARLETGNSMAAVEVAGFVTAGVLAVTSASLWYFALRPASNTLAARARGRIARIACGAGPGLFGIACAIGY